MLMGLRGVETGDGVATLEMAKSPWLCNAVGVIYGGAIAYLADAEQRTSLCQARGGLLLRRGLWPVLAGVKLVPARARVAVSGGAAA